MEVAKLAVEDRYPTRQGRSTYFIERDEPTVWGGVDGPYNEDQLSEYARNGFRTEQDLLDGQAIEHLRSELGRLVSSPGVRANERVVCEKTGREVRSIFGAHELSSAVDDVVRSSCLVDRARQILGSDVYLHQTRLNCKPGFDGSGFYWHSDFETWHAEDGMPKMRSLSALIALTENYAYNGAMMIVPGSHRIYVSCSGRTPRENYKLSLQEQHVGVPDRKRLTTLVEQGGISQIVGPVGSTTFFDSNCMHGSASNITPRPRANLFVVFNSVENALVGPFSATDPRPEYIASRRVSPL